MTQSLRSKGFYILLTYDCLAARMMGGMCMNKKKIFKIILIILALVLLFFVVRTVRNFIIITDLQNKIAEYSNSTNHHIKIVSNQSDGTILTTNYYKKDDKEVVFLERNLNGELTKISMYENGESRNMYTETKDNKVVNLHSGFIEVQIFNLLIFLVPGLYYYLIMFP